MGVNVIEEMVLIIIVTNLYEYVLGAEPSSTVFWWWTHWLLILTNDHVIAMHFQILQTWIQRYLLIFAQLIHFSTSKTDNRRLHFVEFFYLNSWFCKS